MPAAWRELCLAVDEQGPWDDVAEFWAATAGLTWHRGSGAGDPGDLVGEPGQGISLCPVPEPKTVKHRVHIDVNTESIQKLVDLGATTLDDSHRWTVLADPDGGELCGFVRTDPAMVQGYKVYELCVDSENAERIGGWWADRFGVELRKGNEPWCWIEGVTGMPFESVVFVPVPEPKTVSNRIHWDVVGEVAEFMDAGARVLWEQEAWVTLADPEGNEFCVFAPS